MNLFKKKQKFVGIHFFFRFSFVQDHLRRGTCIYLHCSMLVCTPLLRMNSNFELWKIECFKFVDGQGCQRPLFQVSTFSIITRRPWIVIRSRCRLHFSDQSSSPLEARWQSAELHCPTVGAEQVLIFSDCLCLINLYCVRDGCYEILEDFHIQKTLLITDCTTKTLSFIFEP